MLEDGKCENVSLRKLVKLCKQQSEHTRTLLSADIQHLTSFLTTQQIQQLAGELD